MKISFPHLGYCSIPLRSLFADLGHEVIVPPPITRKTISLGTRHGPEFACYPLKLGLGNFIEALELGADTLIMGGGIGPCRFGYYAQVQRDILQSLGYKFKMLIVEPPLGHARQVLAVIKELKGEKSWLRLLRAGQLALAKLRACDDTHRASLKLRPRVQDKPAFSRLYQQALEELDAASGIKAVKTARDKSLAAMEAMPLLDRNPPRVALVGEVYLIAEPAANLRIEEKLGNMGVEVCRHVWISQWLRVNIFLDFLRLHGQEKAEKLAQPYLQCFVGGHGQHSVGETRKAIKDGYDGVIHVYPFTCTPEIVARGIMQKLAAQERMPLACFSMDEHSGEAGFQTRLEAFVDILGDKSKEMNALG
ncbi:MAG: 2-hydroxyacyl-CoA dehydratase [Eubacteriales bacterium]|nr:2-hydroxyacyl-CoA dehydratase [Eubacteriales bacterium]